MKFEITRKGEDILPIMALQGMVAQYREAGYPHGDSVAGFRRWQPLAPVIHQLLDVLTVPDAPLAKLDERLDTYFGTMQALWEIYEGTEGKEG